MDTLVFIYGKDKNLITIREILVERNDVPNEMKKIAKEFKRLLFLEQKIIWIELIIISRKKSLLLIIKINFIKLICYN